MTTTTLTEAHGAIDGGRLDEALALLHVKVSFVIVLSASARRGQGCEDMRIYLSGRGVPDRKHNVLRESHGQRRRTRPRGRDRGPRHDRALPGGRAARYGLPDHQLPGVVSDAPWRGARADVRRLHDVFVRRNLDTDRCRCLLICRNPEAEFPHA